MFNYVDSSNTKETKEEEKSYKIRTTAAGRQKCKTKRRSAPLCAQNPPWPAFATPPPDERRKQNNKMYLFYSYIRNTLLINDLIYYK